MVTHPTSRSYLLIVSENDPSYFCFLTKQLSVAEPVNLNVRSECWYVCERLAGSFSVLQRPLLKKSWNTKQLGGEGNKTCQVSCREKSNRRILSAIIFVGDQVPQHLPSDNVFTGIQKSEQEGHKNAYKSISSKSATVYTCHLCRKQALQWHQ